MSNESILDTPLAIDEIDFRVQSISASGWATILAYKDARVDMKRLNLAYGRGKWQKKYEEIGGRLYCSVGVWNDHIKEWCWVQDVGTESNTEKEKGHASDAFKRACFNLGIGIELYDYPLILVQLEKDEFEVIEERGKKRGRQTWNLKLKQWVWFSQFENGKLICLAAKDQNGKRRFTFGNLKKEN